VPQKFQERFGWAASLLTGGAAQLSSAAFQAQSQGLIDHPDEAMAAGFSVIAAGIATVPFNHFGAARKEAQNAEQAERNHLVRPGMAEALQSALRRAFCSISTTAPCHLRRPAQIGSVPLKAPLD